MDTGTVLLIIIGAVLLVVLLLLLGGGMAMMAGMMSNPGRYRRLLDPGRPDCLDRLHFVICKVKASNHRAAKQTILRMRDSAYFKSG